MILILESKDVGYKNLNDISSKDIHDYRMIIRADLVLIISQDQEWFKIVKWVFEPEYIDEIITMYHFDTIINRHKMGG